MPPFEFHKQDLHRLRRLTFNARIPGMVRQEGQHRNRRSGEGLEFLDYRPYTLGDDVRHIDWNLFGRLRQLIVRVYESQENLSVSILVDTSRSMMFGNPISKVAHACRIACALAYVALANGERLSVATLGESLGPILGPLKRRTAINQVVEYLASSEEGANTRLRDCAERFSSHARRKGLVIVLSDFLSAEGYSPMLKHLLSRGNKLLVIQVMDRVDWGDGLDGYLQIRDSETMEQRFVFVDNQLRQDIKDRVRKYCDGLAAFCRGYGQPYVMTQTQDDCLEVVCHMLRSCFT